MLKRVIGLVAILPFISPGIAVAKEKPDRNRAMATMKEVVVTGTRFEQRIEKVPAHVAVITADQIKASGAQSVPDVLRHLGGVMVRDLNGNGNNQMVDMGGFGETADRHVAVVINGRRVNPIDQSGIRWSLIPVDNIERIEILHGSGSVLYGDNAMGGVINIITKDWIEGQHVNFEGAVGSHDTRKGHMNANFGKEPLGFHLDFTSYKTDGYRDRSETERKHLYGKLRCDATEDMSLFFETAIGRAEFQLPGSLTEEQRDQNREQTVNLNDEGVDKDASVLIGIEADWQERGQWNLNFSLRSENRDSDMASWWSFMTFDVITKGVTSQYILEKPVAGHNNRLTLGVDFYDTAYDAFRGPFKNARTNKFEHAKTTYSGYVQNEFNITEPLLLNMGIRYEKPFIDLGADVNGEQTIAEFDDGETAWNVGLAYHFRPESKIYARFYRSFRYPVVDEFTSLFTGAINTELRQETAYGYEAGMRLYLYSKWLFNLRAYWVDVDDEIAWNNVTNQNENLDETRHLGGEMDFRFQVLPYLAFYGNLGYTDAEFTKGVNDGKDIPLIPDWKANAGAQLDFAFGVTTRIQYNYVGKRFFGNDFGNSQKQLDDYHTLDLYTTYRYQFLEIFLNATNIFNEKFSDFAFYDAFNGTFNYYPMPEAIYYGGVRIKF